MPTKGRDTLNRAISSVAPQLEHGDELLVLRRDNVAYGNATRDEAIPRCIGSHLWWVDDDDVAEPDALATIRKHVSESPELIHVFRMQYPIHGDVLWREEGDWQCGRIGSPMCVIPNVPGKLGSWVHPGVSCGDWNFFDQTLKLQGGPLVWHEEIIYQIKPAWL